MNILVFILTSSPIFLLVVLFAFVIPIVTTIKRRKKRAIKKEILDRKTMIMDSNVSKGMSIIALGIVFILFGILMIFASLTTTEVLGNKITGCVFGGLMCFIPILLFVNNKKEQIKIRTGNYIVTIDTLADKYYYHDMSMDPDRIDHSRWQLYFQDYYKKYNKWVSFKDFKYGDKYQIGDKFYLVFVGGSSYPYIYPLKEYVLSENEKSKLMTLEEAKDFIKLEEFKIEKEVKVEANIKNKEKSIINKKKIIKDFFDKDQKRTLSLDIFATLFALGFMVLVCTNIFGMTLPTLIIAIILISLMFLFLLFMTITKIKYLTDVIKNIKTDNFKIRKDIVISLNNLVQFSDSNKMTSFKFEDYKKIVFADKKDYIGTQIGDEFYLIFVKGKKEPIKVYRVKDSILDNINVENSK